MVSCISLEQTLDLRNRVLRNNAGIAYARFKEDENEGVFHVGNMLNNKIVCVATFIPVNHSDYDGSGFQLRGMATDENQIGKGFGTAVLNFAIRKLIEEKRCYIWCNARKSARSFYEKIGFSVISTEFMIDGIGPHFQMYYKL